MIKIKLFRKHRYLKDETISETELAAYLIAKLINLFKT
jgi:hypothetical protein